MTITLVVVSYNSEAFISGCLDSVLDQTSLFDQIIIVDNNSTDNTVRNIKKYKDIICINLDYNSGYCKAANIGIEKNSSDLCVIANADIIFEKNFVVRTKEYFIENTQTDILSPLMLRFDKQTIDSAGQKYSLALYPKEIGYNKFNDLQLKARKTFSVCGAATIFKTTSLKRLELSGEYYDEDFFMFWEDFDIGWRAFHMNMNVMFYPGSIVYHYRSATLKKNILSKFALSLGRGPEIKFHLVKNRYLVLIKNFHFKKLWYHIPFIIIKDFFWIGMLTISSPKIIIKFVSSINLMKNAFKKRLLIKEMIKGNVKTDDG